MKWGKSTNIDECARIVWPQTTQKKKEGPESYVNFYRDIITFCKKIDPYYTGQRS